MIFNFVANKNVADDNPVVADVKPPPADNKPVAEPRPVAADSRPLVEPRPVAAEKPMAEPQPVVADNRPMAAPRPVMVPVDAKQVSRRCCKHIYKTKDNSCLKIKNILFRAVSGSKPHFYIYTFDYIMYISKRIKESFKKVLCPLASVSLQRTSPVSRPG